MEHINSPIEQYIDDTLTWKLVGSVTGDKSIQVPSSSKEIFVNIIVYGTDIQTEWCIPYFVSGSYTKGFNGSGITGEITLTNDGSGNVSVRAGWTSVQVSGSTIALSSMIMNVYSR